MQITVVLFGLLAMQSSFAEGPVGSVEKAIDKIEAVSKKDCLKCTVEAETKTPLSPRTSCLRQLCPNGFGVVSERTQKAVSEPIDPEMVQKIAPAIMGSVFESLNAQKNGYVSILEFLKKNKSLDDPRAIEFSTIFSAALLLPKLATTEDQQVDEARTRKNFAKEDKSQAELAIKFARYTLALQSDPKAPAILRGHFEHAVQSTEPEALKRQVVEVYKSMVENGKFLAERFGIPLETVVDKSLLDGELGARIKSGNFVSADIDELVANYISNIGFRRVLEDPSAKPYFSGKPVLVEPMLGKNGAERLAKRIEEIDQYIADPKKSSNLEISTTIRVCALTVNYAKAFLPSEKQSAEFRKNEKSHRDKYVKGLSQKISSETSKTLAAEAKNWNLKLPPTPDGFLKKFFEELNVFAQSERNGAEQTVKNRSASGAQSQIAYLIFEDQRSERKQSAYLTRLYDRCKELTPRATPDLAYGVSGNFVLGPLSMTDPEGGEAIEFHEYSHIASVFFQGKKVSESSQKWYRDSRKCVDDLNKGDKTYGPEDWADQVSSNTSIGNLGCLLTSDDKEDFSLVNANADDVHSSHLRRTLSIHHNKNKSIPQVCTDALKELGQTFTTKNCF